MGQALYRKYRSKTLDAVVGQDHVTKTLDRALKSSRISHAYLFTGPRGVGKTSVAGILAHEVNGLKNTGESAHLDIIEIDAASNRRIDEIRDLRERVHITPAAGKYKVYIIDEVHMLTKEAFNALLKTLEEPPAHVIFILATTESHKLPETIISRTQRFSFKPVSAEDITAHLQKLANQEKLSTTKEALRMIAEHSEGSVRDSISLLDQLAAAGQMIDEQAVRRTLGVPKSKNIDALIEYIKHGRSAEILSVLDEFKEQGINPAIAARELSQALRQQLLDGGQAEWLVGLLRHLLDVSVSPHPDEDLEISLLEAADLADTQKNKQSKAKSASAAAATNETVSISQSPSVKQSAFSVKMWPEILLSLRQSGNPCYSALRLAKPEITAGVVTLAFEFSLHQKKVNQVRHKDEIADAIEKLSGQRPKIDCVVDKVLFKGSEEASVIAKKSQKTSASGPLETISNIFGAAEVLES